MIRLYTESNILRRNYNWNLDFKGYLKERTMLQVLRLRISHIAHCVPYFLKEPALSVFLLNEIHISK
jgi:hypothetical protein